MDLRRVSLGIFTVGCALVAPLAHATYKNESEFANNGSIAQILESNINQFLMPKEVQQIGNAIYNEGVQYGALGQEVTSSNPQDNFVSKHESGYCSPNIQAEAKGFACQSKTGQLSNDVLTKEETAQYLEMGDVRTSVLLEPVIYNQALDYAAQNYIRNVTMPFPTQVFANYISNPETFSKNSKQRSAFADYLSNHALLSVVRYALDEMYAMRVPGSILGGTAKDGAPAAQSIMQIMENEATRRFVDSNYVTFLNDTANTLQIDILRDMAAMQAFDLWLQYQNYRQNERIAALLSALVSVNAKGSIAGSVAAVQGIPR